MTLLVYPNPWSAFDKNGLPCGVCPRDPYEDAGGPGQFVGARVDKDRTKVLQDFAAMHGGGGRGAKLAKHELRSPMQETRYQYMGVASDDPLLGELLAGKDPIEIPLTKYYRDRLQEGSLLAADEATAKVARLPRFTSPKDIFAAKTQSTALPEVAGFTGLPPSPDAAGNLLEAPAAATPPVEVASATAEAGGPSVTLEIGADASTEGSASKPNRTRKSSQETSS